MMTMETMFFVGWIVLLLLAFSIKDDIDKAVEQEEEDYDGKSEHHEEKEIQ